ncbi:hypothetical protein [Streptosporangium lutulentum]|uniref:Leucine rich repeat variant n=1 Tax=Streptosporangium lutulentum TaxID=1461250 RepID=A0ABT9QPV3_9ACTN|nr:hypothetical protein [Streptosporangium lutulentum]MDP9848776.1 hypothetical protein [Streptosporangium lutulentum]
MEFDSSRRLTAAERLVCWTVSLLAPDLRSVAQAELRAEGLDVIGPPAVTAPTDGLSGRLRSAATVLDGDAVLSEMRKADWAVLAAEHRREPFGRVQRRALIARPDCPDALTTALLTPWDSFVAGRLVARGRGVPRWTWQAALARIGEVRPSFLRQVLSDETVEEMILTTPRLDLLVRAVDGYDHNHHRETRAFWECVGGLLRRRLGADRSGWTAAAAALPSHPGTFANLLRRIGKTPTPVPAEQADLRILAQAPDAVLAEVVAHLPDVLLTHMERRDLHPRRTREHLISMVLDRFVAAGIPPRGLFARWVYYTVWRTPAARSWAHGLDPLLDEANKRSAAYDVTLRRLLAAGSPPSGAASDLVGALRACTDPIESEALLTSVLGENGSPPWRELIDTHRDAALPPHLLCTLAAREGFPETLARALPADLLPLLAGQSPAAARVAVTAPHRIYDSQGLFHRIRAARVVTDEELPAMSRPAREILRYASTLPAPTSSSSSDGEHGDDLIDHCARLFDTAARSAPAGFWPALLKLLPAFEGTLPELLDAAAAPSHPSHAQRPGDNADG